MRRRSWWRFGDDETLCRHAAAILVDDPRAAADPDDLLDELVELQESLWASWGDFEDVAWLGGSLDPVALPVLAAWLLRRESDVEHLAAEVDRLRPLLRAERLRADWLTVELLRSTFGSPVPVAAIRRTGRIVGALRGRGWGVTGLDFAPLAALVVGRDVPVSEMDAAVSRTVHALRPNTWFRHHHLRWSASVLYYGGLSGQEAAQRYLAVEDEFSGHGLQWHRGTRDDVAMLALLASPPATVCALHRSFYDRLAAITAWHERDAMIQIAGGLTFALLGGEAQVLADVKCVLDYRRLVAQRRAGIFGTLG